MALYPARLDRLQHAAVPIHLSDQGRGLQLEAVRERLDYEGSARGIDRIRDAALMGEDLLRAKGEPHGPFRRQRKGFVHAVRVQGLGAPEDRRERLHRDANRIALRLLGG